MDRAAFDERRLQSLLRAALPVFEEMLAEHAQNGGDTSDVAGCVIDATEEGRGAGKAESGVQAFLVSRERAREIARKVAPDHAHLLEGAPAVGRFQVVAVVGELGAVVELRLAGAREDGEA